MMLSPLGNAQRCYVLTWSGSTRFGFGIYDATRKILVKTNILRCQEEVKCCGSIFAMPPASAPDAQSLSHDATAQNPSALHYSLLLSLSSNFFFLKIHFT